MPDALVDLFPEVKFDKSKLNSKSMILLIIFDLLFLLIVFVIMLDLWHSAEKRRNFFEKYAKDENFDPLVAENWHSRSLQSLMLTKVLIIVIYYY